MKKLLCLLILFTLIRVYAGEIITINPNAPEATCPSGSTLMSFLDNHTTPPDWGRVCCQSMMGACVAYKEAHDHIFDGYQFTYDSTQPTQKTGLKLGLVHYKYTCDAVCNCPNSDASQWQPVITEMKCSKQ